jgi:O-antigen ligase
MRTAAFYGIVAAGLAICAVLLAGGSPARIALACALGLLPFAAYATVVRPMVFPYALYVLLIPFDNLLNFSGSGTLTKLLGMISGFALLFWCVRIRRIVDPPKALLLLGALLLWMTLSVTWSQDPLASFNGLQPYFGLALLYCALAITPLQVREFRVLMFIVVVSGVVSAAYGAHVFYQNPATANSLLHRLVVQVGNTFIDPNQFADALLFPLAALVIFGLRTQWLTLKFASMAGVILMVSAIALSGSREAIVALGVIIVYYLWRTRYRLQLLALIAIGVVGAMAQPSSVWARFNDALSSGGAGRTSIWSVGWIAFKHNWLKGYGIASFPTAYDRFYLGVYQSYTNGWTSPAHNVILHYAVELGIVGLLLLLGFWFAQFSALRVIGPSHPLYDYRVLLEGALLGLFVTAMFIDLFTYKYAWLIFAMAAQLRSLATAPGPDVLPVRGQVQEAQSLTAA